MPRCPPRADLGADGRLYAIGGDGSNQVSLTTVEAYSPTLNTWQPVASMPTARRYLGAATTADGRIIALGGSDGYPSGGSYLGNVEAYTP